MRIEERRPKRRQRERRPSRPSLFSRIGGLFRRSAPRPEAARGTFPPPRGKAIITNGGISRHRLLGIQYLRALAAGGVALFHSAYKCGLSLNAGAAGVDLFFVISGFLMLTITDAETRPSAFFKDRFIRVVPLYWLATTAALIAGLTSASSVPVELWHTAASYLFLPALSPASPVLDRVWPLLLQGWTLSDEMLFYVLVTLALFLPRRAQMPVLTLAIVAMVGIGFVAPRHNAFVIAWTDPIFLEFIFGGWLGVLWRARPNWPVVLGWPLLLLGAALFAAAALLQLPVTRVVAAGLPAVLIVSGTLCLDSKLRGVRRIRPLVLLGDASYSTYLWHSFVVAAAVGTAIDLNVNVYAAFWLCAAAAMLGGVVLHLALEAPLLRLFHRARYRHGAPIPGGV